MYVEEPKWHFGVLSFSGTGHLNPLLALSHELVSRGHNVTFFDKPKAEARIRAAGLEFVVVGAKNVLSQNPSSFHPRGKGSEIELLRSNIARIQSEVRQFIRETPSAVIRAGVNALVVDEVALTGPTVAELLRIPYFIVSTSVPHRFGWKGLSRFSGYRFSASWLS